MTVEKIEDNNELLAIIIRNKFNEEGLNFFSEDQHSLQLGIHNVKKGKRYKAHISLPFEKLENFKSNKIYFVKKGKVGIDIYNNKEEKVDYCTLTQGDLIIFISGGHGVDILDDTYMFEIKQGPYRGREIEKKFLE